VSVTTRASPGRHLVSALLVLLAVLGCVLWARSRANVDMLALFVGG
jgi:hypothetical protein